MEKKTGKISALCKWLVIVAVLSLFFLLCRLWVLFFIGLALSIGMFFRVRVLLKRTEINDFTETSQPSTDSPVQVGIGIEGEKSIAEQITEQVKAHYPEAKWVWAQANSLQRIEMGDDLFILLNRAGGYRRAKVNIVGSAVKAIEFQQAKNDLSATVQGLGTGMPQEAGKDPIKENYELFAFEWVESHIQELDERCNEAIGQGISELILTADELPLAASWPNICTELKRADLSDAECVAEGIKIKFVQETAKEE